MTLQFYSPATIHKLLRICLQNLLMVLYLVEIKLSECEDVAIDWKKLLNLIDRRSTLHVPFSYYSLTTIGMTRTW
jgi:hypothetical protein